jgi:hypothetical protein
MMKPGSRETAARVVFEIQSIEFQVTGGGFISGVLPYSSHGPSKRI